MDAVMDQARLYAQTVFAAVDRRDARAFADFFAADGVFVFANSPEIRGIEAIRQGVDDFFTAVAALRHEVSEGWRGGAKIIDYRIYIDLAPFFATTFG